MRILNKMRMWSNPRDHGWHAAPGHFRCDNGWNDDSGNTWGCRDAGTHEDRWGNWVCNNEKCSEAVVERNLPTYRADS